jgi:flagellar motor protein MotB
MKKQKPVFESFSDFVEALYEMEMKESGSIQSLMESLVPKILKSGNTVSLSDLLQTRIDDTSKSDFEEAIQQLQISASSNESCADELKSFSSTIKKLSNEEWIGGSFFRSGLLNTEYSYDRVDGESVEVMGAPSLSDFKTIIKEVQRMPYRSLVALISAYNASKFLKDLEVQKSNIDKPREIKKVLKGDRKILEKKLPLSFPKDQLLVRVDEKASQINVISLGSMDQGLVNTSSDVLSQDEYASFNKAPKYTMFGGQFKYLFPIPVAYSKGNGELLSIENRQKTIIPDKTKSSSDVSDYPLNLKEQEKGKASFYVTNKADLTEEGKAAVASLSRIFYKIDKIVVEGSADKRTAGSPWKDNTELASARRDEMIKYLKSLSSSDNSCLSGASIESGKVSVQPKEGEQSGDDLMPSWRAIKLNVTGKIYDSIKESLPTDDKTPKVISYSEAKKGDKIQFTNCAICLYYNDAELMSDMKQLKKD